MSKKVEELRDQLAVYASALTKKEIALENISAIVEAAKATSVENAVHKA